jgi:hypothetical protein
MHVYHRRFEMRRSMRLIAVLLAVGAVGLGASAAFSTTGSSTAGSLSFSVTLPDNVTAGQSATWNATMSNTSQVSAVDAQVSFNLSGPGVNLNSLPTAYHFAPGKTLTSKGSFRVPARAQAGTYTLTMNVNAGSNGSGQTTATSTVG